MNAGDADAGAPTPPSYEPWCRTLRGEQAWRVEVAGGATALDAWKILRDSHQESGLWPVILGPDAAMVDQLTWRVDILSEDRPGIPDLADVEPAAELFVRWMGDPAADDALAAALVRIREACEAAGIIAGIHTPSGEVAAQRLAEGFTLVTVAHDVGHLVSAAATHLETARR